QEIGQKIATERPTTSVAIYRDSVFVVAGGALKTLGDGVLNDASDAPAGIKRLRSLGEALWAAADGGTYRYAGDKWDRVDEHSFNDFCVHLGKVYGATRDAIFRFEADKFVNIRPA